MCGVQLKATVGIGCEALTSDQDFTSASIDDCIIVFELSPAHDGATIDACHMHAKFVAVHVYN